MAIYNRRQAALLLSLVGAAGLGIAIGHWRQTHPELAERLEQLDRAPEAAAVARADDPRVGLDPRRGDDGARDTTRGHAPRSDLARSDDDGDDEALPSESGAGTAARTRSVAVAGDGGGLGSRSTTGPGSRRLTARATPLAPVDLNQATVADLQKLPGVGPVLASRIVGARESTGPFASVDELRRVSGIGDAKLDRMRAMVTVSP